MNTKIIIGSIVTILVIIGLSAYFSNNSKSAVMNKDIVMQDGEIKNDNSFTNKDTSVAMDTKTVQNDIPAQSQDMQKDQVIVMDKELEQSETVKKMGIYEVYSPEKIARAETGDNVLFFHASWCPSCRRLNSDIEDNSSSIPQGLTILKVDYNKETELKKKYGVTTQHTLVQVDKDGNLIAKWSGGSTLTNLVSRIK